jgi:hypothetical protein
MDTSRLDDDTVDRILAGLVAPIDAPPGYEAAVSLLAVARGLPAPPPRSVARPAARAAFGVRPRLPVIAAALVLGGASGAAYAAGLPAEASSTAHHVLRSLGVSSSPRRHPRPAAASTQPRTMAETTATRHAPAPASSAAGHGHPRATRHVPAKGHGHGAAISALAHSTTGTAGAKGATVSAAASGGKSHAGEHGHNGKSGASHGQGHGHGQHGSHRPR